VVSEWVYFRESVPFSDKVFAEPRRTIVPIYQSEISPPGHVGHHCAPHILLNEF